MVAGMNKVSTGGAARKDVQLAARKQANVGRRLADRQSKSDEQVSNPAAATFSPKEEK
jgi:hypothetical protein